MRNIQSILPNFSTLWLKQLSYSTNLILSSLLLKVFNSSTLPQGDV